jgi:hypothetical protein
MQKRHGRFLRHASIAVSRSGTYSFKQSQYRANAAYRVERRYQRQFGCPRVGKTYFHPGIFSRLQNYLRSGHNISPYMIKKMFYVLSFTFMLDDDLFFIRTEYMKKAYGRQENLNIGNDRRSFSHIDIDSPIG